MMVVTEPKANPNEPPQIPKTENVTAEVHKSHQREGVESDAVTPTNNNNNTIPGKLTPDNEQSSCAECELANQAEKTSLLLSPDSKTDQTTDQLTLPVPSTSNEIPTNDDTCATTPTVTSLGSTSVSEHVVDRPTNSKERTSFSQSSSSFSPKEKPSLKTKLPESDGKYSVSKTSGSCGDKQSAVDTPSGTDQEAITKAFAPPAYEDVVPSPTQDRKGSTKSSGSVESSKAGSLSSQKTDIGATTPGGGEVGGRHVSQRSTSSRFTITPSLKDPLRRVLEKESPLTRHKVSSVSTILSESPLTPHRVSTVSTAPSAENGSLATRIPSSVSSIKEDDNCSILDEVFWSPVPLRNLEQDCNSIEAEEGIQMKDLQDSEESDTSSNQKQQHRVRILVDDEDVVERENRLYDHTGELKRRLSAVPSPIPNPKPNDYIMLSCVVICCCNPFLGVVAMVCAFISNGSYQNGDVGKATRYSRLALLLSILGILMTTLIVLTFLIVYWPSERPDPTPMND